MKTLLFLLFGLLFFASSTYGQEKDSITLLWEKVEIAGEDGLPQTALKLAKNIYQKAAEADKEQQQIKALLYQFKYRDQIEDDALLKNIRETDSLVKTQEGITKKLLQFLSARLYFAYLQQNRYKIQDRSSFSPEGNNKIDTWSLPRLYNHVDSLYQEALNTPELLTEIKITTYPVLIDEGKNSSTIRPTLYDVMAHEVLSFYTSQSTLLKQAEEIIFDHSDYFAPAEDFAGLSLEDEPQGAGKKILSLYQSLIRSHLKKGDEEALAAIHLERLRFVYDHHILPEKDNLYVNALEQTIDELPSPVNYEATAALAQWYADQGNTFQLHEDTTHRWDLAKAVDLARSVPEEASSQGALQVRKIKEDLLRPGLSLKIETVNIPDQPFRTLVTYKNLEHLWLRIVRLKEDPQTVFKEKTNLTTLLNQETVRDFKTALPLPKDYQNHATEIKIDPLPAGRYSLMASPDSTFEDTAQLIVSTDFLVSGLSYISDNEGRFLVLNRQNGKPVKKAEIIIWKREYDSKTRETKLIKQETLQTNQEGYFHIRTENAQKAIFPEITTSKDHLFLLRENNIPYRQAGTIGNTKKPETKGLLFTDRAIYRPGQDLFYKGIIYMHDPNEEDHIIEEKKGKIFLYDVNNKIIDTALFSTNDFGSFHGKFKLPSAGLNGNFRLSIENITASASFRVENYKRPQFYMEWENEASTRKLGDSVRAAGQLIGYNGAPVAGAQIRYVVKRKPYFIPFSGANFSTYRPPFFPNFKEITLAQGEIESAADGNFSIPFIALPDLSLPEGKRIFNYEITADVTDINGESHTYTQNIPVGDQSLLLHLNTAEKTQTPLDSIRIHSTDLKGNFIPTQVEISISPLRPTKQLVNARYWERPDQFLMDEETFKQFFPHEEYKKEADYKNWERENPVYVKTDSTKESGSVSFHPADLASGYYLIKVSGTDSFEKPIADSQYLEIIGEKDKKLPFPKALWLNQENLTGEPGTDVHWQIGSSENVRIFSLTEGLKRKEESASQKVNTRITTQQLPIKKEDLGGLTRYYATVLNNRLYTQSLNVSVPYEDKSLEIEYETFRDKIVPGEKENWSLKITDKNGEKINAEILASMYDRSLDEFTPQHWGRFPDLNPYPIRKTGWNGQISFSDKSAQVIQTPKVREYPDLSIVYPFFKDFGYRFPSSFYPMPRYATASSPVLQTMVRKSDANAEGYLMDEVQEESTGNTEASASGASETEDTPPVQIRKDFRETAFFYPQLKTDEEGHVSFSFVSPEALTRWKLMVFGHTKDLRFAYSDKETLTQKPLMIQMNAPRFVRQGDHIFLTAKINNPSDETQEGEAALQFRKATDSSQVPLLLSDEKQSFRVDPNEAKSITWSLSVPKDFSDALVYTVTATGTSYSDGEEDLIPVLSNQYFLTETLPFYLTGNAEEDYTWESFSRLQEKGRRPEGITLEFTGNPIWYAVQALPFIEEENEESATSLFRKVYANALSRNLILKIPNFKQTMKEWIATDSTALKSPLQKNEELKDILLEETPWVQSAEKEAAQKARIAHWYEEEEEQLALNTTINKLKELQRPSGGFSWFKEMPESRFITQEILTGIGHLKSLQAQPFIGRNTLEELAKKAVPFLDAEMQDSYNHLKKSGQLSKIALTSTDIQYLYMRSFFPEIQREDSTEIGYDYFYKKAKEEWQKQSAAKKAMLALFFHRNKEQGPALQILRSLEETAISDVYNGLHWKKESDPWQNTDPITTQALAMEAFRELEAPKESLNKMRNWLLNQKRVQFWDTQKNTADAVYALLLTGDDMTASSPDIHVQVGDTTFTWPGGAPGAQYKKIFIGKEQIKENMDQIKVRVEGSQADQPVWGAAYVQYFEEMEQVEKGEGTDLHIERQLTKEVETDMGKELLPIRETDTLQVGDKVQVRLVLKADRDIDFVHLKDVRASAMEPLQVLSGYRWQDGISFYTDVKDAAIHYFFRRIPQGTYVLSYPVFIQQKGNLTGGLSTIESIYAPEIKDHSEGVRVRVE